MMILAFIRRNYLAILTAVFWLVVIAYVVSGLVIHVFNVDKQSRAFDIFMYFYAPIFITLWIALNALIFVRKFRDEYLEKIWQRSMRSFGVIIFVVPWLWVIAWIIHGLFFRNDYWLLKDPNAFLFDFNGDNPHNISQLQKSGVDFAMHILLNFSPIVFAALFKWHAWRDRD